MAISTYMLIEIWQKTLGVPIDPDDDFFAAGGDSLLALTVVEQARAKGAQISLLDIYRKPTIRQLLADDQPELVAREGPQLSQGNIPDADRRALPEGVESAYPATRLQLGMIFETEMLGESLYHDVVTQRIHGNYDAEALRSALDLVTRRHEALRTSLDLTSYSIPLQLVHREVVIPLEVIADAGVEESIARAGRAFDLSTAPLIRIVVSSLDGDGFQLTYGFHHAIMDGWSEGRFAWELMTAYDALISKRSPDLGPAPVSMASYVALEREASASLEAAAFWSRHSEIEIEIEATTISRSWQPHRTALQISLEITAAEFDNARRRYQASAKTILAAAHLRALSMLRDTERPVTGLVVNGRPEVAGGDAMIGLFLNVVPLSLRLGGKDSELVSGVQRFEVEMMAHRRYPHAEIVRQAGRGALFDTAFNYVRFRMRGELKNLTSVQVGPPDVRDRTSLPMLVDLVHDADSGELVLGLSADSEIYPRAALADFVEAHQTSILRLVMGRGEQ